MAAHTASTLEVQTDHFSVLEFGVHSETNITPGFGCKSKTASLNAYYYSVFLLFAVGTYPVLLRTLALPGYFVTKL